MRRAASTAAALVQEWRREGALGSSGALDATRWPASHGCFRHPASLTDYNFLSSTPMLSSLYGNCKEQTSATSNSHASSRLYCKTCTVRHEGQFVRRASQARPLPRLASRQRQTDARRPSIPEQPRLDTRAAPSITPSHARTHTTQTQGTEHWLSRRGGSFIHRPAGCRGEQS